MTYSWIATSSYNTALQRMLYFVLAKTIERFFILGGSIRFATHHERRTVRPISKHLTQKILYFIDFSNFTIRS